MEARNHTGSFTSPYFTSTPPPALPQRPGNNVSNNSTTMPSSNAVRLVAQRNFQQSVQGRPPQNSSLTPAVPLPLTAQQLQSVPFDQRAGIQQLPPALQQKIYKDMIQKLRAMTQVQESQNMQNRLTPPAVQPAGPTKPGTMPPALPPTKPGTMQPALPPTRQGAVPPAWTTPPGTMATRPSVVPSAVSNSPSRMPPSLPPMPQRGLSSLPQCIPYHQLPPLSGQTRTITLEDEESEYLDDESVDMEDEEPEYVEEKSEFTTSRKRLREELKGEPEKAEKAEEIYRSIHRIGQQSLEDKKSLIENLFKIVEEGKTKRGGLKKKFLKKIVSQLTSQKKRMENFKFPELPPVSNTTTTTTTTSSQPPVKKRKVVVKKPSEYTVHPKLCTDLAQLIEKEEGSDVIFLVDGEKFHAHTPILVARSEYFQRLFLGQFSEGKSAKEGQKQTIEFKECNKEEFKVLLRYLYTGNLSIDNQSILKLYALADRIGIKEMETLCIKHLENTLTLNNTIPLLMECYQLGIDETPCGEAIFRHLIKYSERLLGTFIFNESNLFPESLIMRLLASDHLILERDCSDNEYAIYSFVQQWLYLSQAGEEVKENIKSLIRLDLMNTLNLRNLRRQTDCLFDLKTLDDLSKNGGKIESPSIHRTPSALAILDVKGLTIVSNTTHDIVFFMNIPLNTPLEGGKFLVTTWNELKINYHGDANGISLDNPKLSLTVEANPEKLTGVDVLVEAVVELVSPSVTQDSIISAEKILQMSRERFMDTIPLNVLFKDKEKVKELITRNQFSLKVRLHKIS